MALIIKHWKQSLVPLAKGISREIKFPAVMKNFIAAINQSTFYSDYEYEIGNTAVPRLFGAC